MESKEELASKANILLRRIKTFSCPEYKDIYTKAYFKEDEKLKRIYLNDFFKSIGEDFIKDNKLKNKLLLEFFEKLIKVKHEIKRIKKEIKEFPPQFNIFDSINLLNHENYNSNLFANFLDIKFKHNGNEISFAKLFLKYLNEEFGWEFDLENIKI